MLSTQRPQARRLTLQKTGEPHPLHVPSLHTPHLVTSHDAPLNANRWVYTVTAWHHISLCKVWHVLRSSSQASSLFSEVA